MVERVSALPPRTAILYGGLIVDGAGVPHELDEGLDRLYAAANAPIFGMFDTQMGRGIVGGRLVSVSEASRRAAGAALRILCGEEPSSLQTEPVTAGAPVYDHRELVRWGIPETRLPEGSTVQFRPVSLWTLYMWPAILGLTLVGAEIALLAGLLLQRARRRRAEEEARALSRRLLTAHEDERRRLARELHDDMSQRLARLTIDVGRIEDALEAVSGNGASTAASDGLARLSEDVHSLSYQLHPSLIEDLGLFEALQEECERFSDVEGIPAMLNAAKLTKELPPEASLCLFRVAQEALRNVSRHAHASRVSVSLGPVNGGVRLSVTDDGAGFDKKEQAKRASLGLASMRERVGLVSGRLEIESAVGGGTAVSVWVPGKGGTA
jgi:signal transduction histidine kinase